MKEKKLIEWFDEKLQNCYHIVRDDGYIIWVYDKNYIRKLKLTEIDGREVNPPVYDKDKVLFYQNQKTKWFNCDYYKIWSFLEDNYSPDYRVVQSFIKTRLDSNHNLKMFAPEINLNQFTPYINTNKDIFI